MSLSDKIDRKGAFTIIELLLVLAIMGLVATLFIVNIEQTLDTVTDVSAQEQLIAAVKDARLQAVTLKKPIWLEFDRESSAFVLFNSDGTESSRYGLDSSDQNYWEAAVFWPIEPLRYGSRLDRGEWIEPSSNRLERIRFEPDGTSHFVAIEWIPSDRSESSNWVVLDPFSNALVEVDLS